MEWREREGSEGGGERERVAREGEGQTVDLIMQT